MEDLPRELRDQMKFVYATDIKQVLDAALEPRAGERGAGKAGEDDRERAKGREVEKVAAQAQ